MPSKKEKGREKERAAKRETASAGHDSSQSSGLAHERSGCAKKRSLSKQCGPCSEQAVKQASKKAAQLDDETHWSTLGQLEDDKKQEERERSSLEDAIGGNLLQRSLEHDHASKQTSNAATS